MSVWSENGLTPRQLRDEMMEPGNRVVRWGLSLYLLVIVVVVFVGLFA